MLEVVARMGVNPTVKHDYIQLVEELVAKTVLEDGCIGYHLCQESEKADEYAIVETWENQQYLDAHMQSEHFQRLIPQITNLTNSGIQIAVYDVLK
ncbi:MAG: antibiotic biosynthesis monooxygenase [Coriobacteriales bacterium]|jgi:quinol monooxygenase YgiN|nr:antibiotic biosynthesis monooxygenase [Coriobacteriales bacterium]